MKKFINAIFTFFKNIKTSKIERREIEYRNGQVKTAVLTAIADFKNEIDVAVKDVYAKANEFLEFDLETYINRLSARNATKLGNEIDELIQVQYGFIYDKVSHFRKLGWYADWKRGE
jgi:hypothetical protein